MTLNPPGLELTIILESPAEAGLSLIYHEATAQP